MATAMSGDAARASTPDSDSMRLARWIALLLPLSLLAGALGLQKLSGLVPCEMCHWQRFPHYFAILAALLAFGAPTQAGRRSALWMAAAAIALSGAIGVYHAGLELGLFEGLTTCTSTARGASTEDLLKSIVSAPVVRCDQVQWAFLGISMAGWNAIWSLGGAAAIAFLLLKSRSR